MAKPRDAAMIEGVKTAGKAGDMAGMSGTGGAKSGEKDHAGMGHDSAGSDGMNAGGKSQGQSEHQMSQSLSGQHAMHSQSTQPMQQPAQKEPEPEGPLQIGAKGFFLDRSQKLTLSADQAKTIGEIKERSAMEMMKADKKIQEAEEQLWKLTSSDRPALAEIETKVREVEGLRARQRIVFIRSVSEAANLLTAEQMKLLVRQAGDMKPEPQKSGQAEEKQTGKAEEKSETAHKH